MKQFNKLKYNEVETKKIDNYETSFAVQPLERGFANTLGNALRRTLLSSITGVAPFAIKVKGVEHEFQTIKDVTEDAVQLILNIKNVKFVYNTEIFKDGEVVKVTLKSAAGDVFAKDLSLPAGVEIINLDQKIATVNKAGALELELFLIAGRGYTSFEKNKVLLKELQTQMETKLKTGEFIAIDSDFTPIVNVSYKSEELNSSSAIIEEKLTLNVKTDGTVEAKDVVAQAANILLSHLEVLSNVSNIERDEIFKEKTSDDDAGIAPSTPITALDLSVRSYNCLKRAGYETLDDLAKLTKKDLQNINNLGTKSVEEIIEKLKGQSIDVEGEK